MNTGFCSSKYLQREQDSSISTYCFKGLNTSRRLSALRRITRMGVAGSRAPEVLGLAQPTAARKPARPRHPHAGAAGLLEPHQASTFSTFRLRTVLVLKSVVAVPRARLRPLLSRAALLAVAACLVACGAPRPTPGPGADGASGELKVVTTFLPITLFTRAVAPR